MRNDRAIWFQVKAGPGDVQASQAYRDRGERFAQVYPCNGGYRFEVYRMHVSPDYVPFRSGELLLQGAGRTLARAKAKVLAFMETQEDHKD